jgi:hypothetical protein
VRKVPFTVEPGVGRGEFPREGDLADLLFAIPYLLMDEIPPLAVLNDVLRRGREDAGMSGGCIWEPFEIDATEYGELVEELQRRGQRGVLGRSPGGARFQHRDLPASISTFGAWAAFRHEEKTGLRAPALETAEPLPSYQDWLDGLPVAELYRSYVQACDPDWRTRPDTAFDLPAELVARIRRLEDLLGERAAPSKPQGWTEWGVRAEQVEREIRDVVDRTGLPRWPYERFGVPTASSQTD